MTLELIILLIILIPIVLIVILKRRKGMKTAFSKILLQILGVFMLVFGSLMLFVSLFKFFHENISASGIGLVIASLLLVLGGYVATNRAGKGTNRT